MIFMIFITSQRTGIDLSDPKPASPPMDAPPGLLLVSPHSRVNSRKTGDQDLWWTVDRGPVALWPELHSSAGIRTGTSIFPTTRPLRCPGLRSKEVWRKSSAVHKSHKSQAERPLLHGQPFPSGLKELLSQHEHPNSEQVRNNITELQLLLPLLARRLFHHFLSHTSPPRFSSPFPT